MTVHRNGCRPIDRPSCRIPEHFLRRAFLWIVFSNSAAEERFSPGASASSDHAVYHRQHQKYQVRKNHYRKVHFLPPSGGKYLPDLFRLSLFYNCWQCARHLFRKIPANRSKATLCRYRHPEISHQWSLYCAQDCGSRSGGRNSTRPDNRHPVNVPCRMHGYLCLKHLPANVPGYRHN